MIPENGFYIVNTFNTIPVTINMTEYITRDSVTLTSSVLKYNYKIIEDTIMYYNELGTIISFQLIENAENYLDAQNKFNDEEYFGATYRKLLKTSSGLITEKRNTDSTSICNIYIDNENMNDMTGNITWIYTSISNTSSYYVYLEALFVFQITTRIEEGLLQLLTNRDNPRFIDNLSKYMEDVFFIEQPENYLTNLYEVNTMVIFYDVWRIRTKIDHIKDRFNLSLANSDLRKEHFNERNSNLINLFLSGIAIFSATQSVSSIKKAIPSINEDLFVTYLFFLASSFIGYAIIKYYIIYSIRELLYKRKQYLILSRFTTRSADVFVNFFMDLRFRKLLINVCIFITFLS